MLRSPSTRAVAAETLAGGSVCCECVVSLTFSVPVFVCKNSSVCESAPRGMLPYTTPSANESFFHNSIQYKQPQHATLVL